MQQARFGRQQQSELSPQCVEPNFTDFVELMGAGIGNEEFLTPSNKVLNSGTLQKDLRITRITHAGATEQLLVFLEGRVDFPFSLGPGNNRPHSYHVNPEGYYDEDYDDQYILVATPVPLGVVPCGIRASLHDGV